MRAYVASCLHCLLCGGFVARKFIVEAAACCNTEVASLAQHASTKHVAVFMVCNCVNAGNDHAHGCPVPRSAMASETHALAGAV